MSVWSRIANRVITRVIPPVHQRGVVDWFTQFEANNESWEPNQLSTKPKNNRP